MEARRKRVPPGSGGAPGTGASVATLTHSVSQTLHEPAPEPVPRQIPRRYVALGLIVVAICLLGALVLVRDNAAPSSSSTTETFNAAPSSLISSMASVPTAVYDAVGVDSPTVPLTSLQPTGSAHVLARLGARSPTQNRSCSSTAPSSHRTRRPSAGPWCWPCRASGPSTSSASCSRARPRAFANLNTFTFWQARYSSKYLALEHVERYSALNPTGGRYLKLEKPDARQAAAVSNYSSSPTNFALLDVGNRWVLNGSSFAPPALAGMTQSQVAARPDVTDEPAHPGRHRIGQRDQRGHLQRRRPGAGVGVRLEGRGGRGPGYEDLAAGGSGLALIRDRRVASIPATAVPCDCPALQ